VCRHKSRFFENNLLRKIFGPKRKEVTIGWKNLKNEELLAQVLLE
jgi:hypothetical protein